MPLRDGLSRTTLALAAIALALPAAPALAAGERQQALVDRATLTVREMFNGARPDSKITRYMSQARAVMVCPSIFRMSIGFGGAGGGCALLSRDARGSWSDPAFYTLSSANVGIQLGMQDSQMMFFVMTDRGLQALLDSQFQFGANASASFATMGSGIESGTAGERNTDIMALQKSEGLFAGAALGGSKLTVNSGANRAYYNQIVGPEDIVVSMRVNNPGADPLRAALSEVQARATAGAPAMPPPAYAQPTQGGEPAQVNVPSSGPVSSQPLSPP
ncbi:lipid-binding SYLF domain-containing protein [Gluconacetobacter takamatsuzukensis]|uniref:Lipid-binding SYLF domain-containing protein n=1 Tax=Gluconacetobacter takamatsuzukensis TaxID=1286190 RepID=A0A7W4KGF0_9PROT|nr:lipid-binding SYLF domain-containing protein [Gluconacetobacter takamatsuzukensis]MBB2206355.1 lipid-binding SYLF domain-containing protein [Gluconacetobacter takamatsuzukensis]